MEAKFDQYTGQPLRQPPPQRQQNPYPPYHPTNQVIDARMSEFEDRIIAAISGAKTQETQQPQAQPFTLDLAPVAPTTAQSQAVPTWNQGQLEGMFIPVNSLQEAMAHKAIDSMKWIQGDPLYFVNKNADEYYKTWFDASTNPPHCIEVARVSKPEYVQESLAEPVPTPDPTPLINELKEQITSMQGQFDNIIELLKSKSDEPKQEEAKPRGRGRHSATKAEGDTE